MIKQLDKLSEMATQTAKAAGFAVRSPLAERHGSYQMVFVKDDGMHRFVVLGISIRSNADSLLELYAIAEDAEHSQRKLCSSFRLELAHLETWIQTPVLHEALAEAFTAAQALKPTDLKRLLTFSSHPPATFSAVQ